MGRKKCITLEQAFDLAATLNSGQAFHWTEEADGFVGLVGDAPVELRQPEPSKIEIFSPQPKAVESYLGLDHPLDKIVASFPKRDAPLRAAMAYCDGLRILRQPRWECLATFITSSLKQVPHIRAISLKLRERFGNRVSHLSHTLYTYPTPEVLAEAGEEALRSCGLGYRAKSVHRAAVAISDGTFDLAAPDEMDDDEAREYLVQLYGVGDKIANCVLLFAYERLASFPVDVWVERVVRELYFDGSPDPSPREIAEFAENHFGPYRGYAQQFLFHYARTSDAKLPRRKNPSKTRSKPQAKGG